MTADTLTANEHAILDALLASDQPRSIMDVSREPAGPLPARRDNRTREMKAWQQRRRELLDACIDLWGKGLVAETIAADGEQPSLVVANPLDVTATPYAVVWDSRISLAARGLLLNMLSYHPPAGRVADEFSLRQRSPKDSPDETRAQLRELIEAGYVIVTEHGPDDRTDTWYRVTPELDGIPEEVIKEHARRDVAALLTAGTEGAGQ